MSFEAAVRLTATPIVLQPNPRLPVGQYAQLCLRSPSSRIFFWLTKADALILGKRLHNFFARSASAKERGSIEVAPAGMERKSVAEMQAFPAMESLLPPASGSGDRLFKLSHLAQRRTSYSDKDTASLQADMAALEPELAQYLHWTISQVFRSLPADLSLANAAKLHNGVLREVLILLADFRSTYMSLLGDIPGENGPNKMD